MENYPIKAKRDIPAVEILASDATIGAAGEMLPRPLQVEIIRAVVEQFKENLAGQPGGSDYMSLRTAITAALMQAGRRNVRRVINGTGILVHTNLGRAPLAEELFDRIKGQVTGYGNLEFDINSGRRGHRGEQAEKYLALLSEAASGAIVNNNAAALFIILNTLANRKKVVISRGEMVQIGGGFRIPDIIRRSGAGIIEVGTTNITTVDDYRRALNENPALILKVHRSNFDITGFTDEAELRQLVPLGEESGVPVINDLGSGVFIDTTEFAGHREPTVQDSVRGGAALTCFSGDKLLGGVQAGLIVGTANLVERIKKNPLYRTVRADKIVFSVMEELLGYYLNNTWREKIKLWRLAGVKESHLYDRGRQILKDVAAGDKIILEGSQGEMGGGSLPGRPLPSVALVFQSRLSAAKLAALFRASEPPVIGRIEGERFMIDLKAIDEDDTARLITAIKALQDKI